MKAFSGIKAFLSNMYVDNEGFCVEYRYQAEKACNDGDREWILSAKTPYEAKKRGRKVQKWDKFDENKEAIMLKWTRRKYQNPELRQMLLDTGNETLTEFNYWHDTFFGICDGTCRNPHKDPIGENRLGKILMQVREEIRNA